MSTKLLRVPSETYDALKVMSTKQKTTMSDLLQRAVIDMSIQEMQAPDPIKAYDGPPSDAELLTLMATILEARTNKR